MSQTIAIINQKGGVGKTSTAINFSASLVENNKKVLIVDLDPQANLTMCLGYAEPEEIKITLPHLISNEIVKRMGGDCKEFIKEDYILNTKGIEFIPSSIELSGIENNLMNVISRENILKDFLSNIKKDYDYIIIDCPPSLNILTINALNASDEVIIPVQSQYLSAKGLEMLLKTVSTVKKNLNKNLEISGILITMLDKRATNQKDVVNVITNAYGKHIKIFENIIPTSVKMAEMQSIGKSAIDFDKKGKIAISYKAFTDEYLKGVV